MEYEQLRCAVYEANMLLPKYQLVTFTWGNVSQLDKDAGVFAIKPSGVDYEALRPEDMVVLDLDGRKVAGSLNPSSDTKTHLSCPSGFHLRQRGLCPEDLSRAHGIPRRRRRISGRLRYRYVASSSMPPFRLFHHNNIVFSEILKHCIRTIYNALKFFVNLSQHICVLCLRLIDHSPFKLRV